MKHPEKCPDCKTPWINMNYDGGLEPIFTPDEPNVIGGPGTYNIECTCCGYRGQVRYKLYFDEVQAVKSDDNV